ncbi:MAG: hypothetical protein QG602_2643 [Verrucomicrobiota bacterium]|nr:hypothetical protein [Verrucomicrobiota bacterium]
MIVINSYHKKLIRLLTGVMLAPALLAQSSAPESLALLSFEELALVEVSAMTINPTSWRNQPAVMTIFRAQDFASLGTKNLQEVLELVPGFSRGADVFGINSLLVRGHWAHEGKVLLLVDDMPVNDLMYGSISLSRHYPTELLERIEVVRGAGTARHGGNAQLAVIRLITRTPEVSGARFSVTTDHVEGTDWSREATFSSAWVGQNGYVTLSGHLGKLSFSAENWEDNAGRTFALGNLTGLETAGLYGKADWHGLRVRFLADRQITRSPQKFGYGQRGESVEFSSLNWSAEYDWEISPSLTVTPRYWHREQEDWFIDRDPALTPTVDFFLPASAGQASIELRQSGRNTNVVAGLERREETIRAQSPGGPPGARDPALYFNGRPSASYQTNAAYAQVDHTHGDWLATAGLRYSDHSYAGDSLVPRTAVTYTRKTWHLKAVAGRAFREPNMEVINSSFQGGPAISPETTTQLEFEAGWQPSPGSYGSINIYKMRIEDPIVYTSFANDYYYNNNPSVATSGLEWTWHQQLGIHQLSAGFSHYRATPILAYAVPGEPHELLGSPRQKAYLTFDLNPGGGAWRTGLSAVWYSAHHAAVHEPGAQDLLGNELAIKRQSAQLLLNLNLRYTHENWEMRLGVDNLLNTRRNLPQPYQGESTPIPDAGRRIWLTLGWQWK